MSRKPTLPPSEDSPPGVPAPPELPPTYHRLNDRGLIEVVDMNTGRIIAVQTSAQDLLQSKWERLVRIDTPEGPVWLEKGLNFDLIKHLPAHPYSKLLADLICEKIVEGMTLVNAAKDLNLKYSTILRWKRENEEFKLALLQAEKDRAGTFHDEVLDVARKADSKTKIAALQWAAEKGDAEKFSPKTKIGEGNVGAIQIVLATGIVRPGDPGYVAHVVEPRDVGPTLTPSSEIEAEEVAEYVPNGEK